MSKKLVAYFSASGTTARVAKNLAAAAGADLYEIKPAVPYSRADLNWMDKQSRSSVEMRDKSSRPELADTNANIADYDTVFIGFPVWWGDKPMPVYTFIESYNFKGKDIIPFCTHEGSGFCGTQGMEKTGAKILNGLALYGHIAQNDKIKADRQVSEWLKELGF